VRHENVAQRGQWHIRHDELTSHAVAAVDDIRGVVPDDDLGRRRTRLPRAWATTSPEQDESRPGDLAVGSLWLRERGHQCRRSRQKRTSAAGWHVSSRSGILRTSDRHERRSGWRRALYYNAPHGYTMGWRSLPPGIDFRLVLIGYFEGIDPEGGIERTGDSLALRDFLGVDPAGAGPQGDRRARAGSMTDGVLARGGGEAERPRAWGRSAGASAPASLGMAEVEHNPRNNRMRAIQRDPPHVHAFRHRRAGGGAETRSRPVSRVTSGEAAG